jgi:transcription-repair coupling factor (superfamily II helicase)
MFGLSDLHQMRGRVGRSNKKAYCYLLTPSAGLANDSRKRLHVLEEFSDLGDGFKVAMRDLDIRGAGNLLGAEQSGFVTDIGFDMYHKILDEAIQELKENEFAALFQDELNLQNVKKFTKDCVIESDLTILIPETYVQNISERLSLYSALDNVKNKEELDVFLNEITDRFGKIPQEVLDLVKTVEMRWVAEELGIEKIHLKSGGLKAQFVQEENKKFYESETFGKIIHYIQSKSKLLKLKESNKKLLLLADDIQSIDQALSLFQEMKIKCLNQTNQ